MKKNILQNIFLFLSLIIFSTSCVTQKKIAYFQKGTGSDTINVAQAYIPRIQPGDILTIPIGSLNPNASSFFNPYQMMPGNTGADASTSSNSATSPSGSGQTATPALTQAAAPGYLVDADGAIEMPILGSIKLGGLTTSEARILIKSRLKDYLKEPTVSVRVMNYKISVMGEVLHPSVYVIPNERITLPEAISLAGDLTIYGRRDNVLIIRDENGKKQFGRIDLRSREIYNSPYYYLHDNDVVYVEPGKGKTAQSDRIYAVLPVILSALSFVTIIFAYSHRNP